MPDVVVLGAGANGLACALTLRERGASVAIWTRDEPRDTVSAVAGAIWYPFLAEPRERVLGWSAITFARLRTFAADAATGVRMQPVVELFDRDEPDVWWAAAADRVERLPRAQVPAPFRAAIRTVVPVCDTTVHLPWLVATARDRGIAIERRTVRSFDEAFAQADAVVNCTGLGAIELCGDRELVPVRGQVLLVEPPNGAAAVPHALIHDGAGRPTYVLPRGRDVVLGGTAQRGDTRTTIDDADTNAIRAGVAAHWPQLAALPARTIRVGLRPYRSAVRVEREPRADGRALVHDYGHGGSGYTLNWGCAAEVAGLLGR